MLQDRIKKLPTTSGIYQMLDKRNQVIYVGKAKNIRNRVKSYFQHSARKSRKIALMVGQIFEIEIIITHTEAEALLLESNLIKKHRPKFNIVFRDDTSYPYLHLSEHNFPRISFYRGKRKLPGKYFGPYPDSYAVRHTIRLAQKLFRIRPCSDTVFANRSRPCLQYQINHCTGPCVGNISQTDYQQDLERTILFLEGNDQELLDKLTSKMQQAAINLDYEQATVYRDQIRSIRSVQARHVLVEKSDVDIIVCLMEEDICCVQVFFIRNGVNLGGKAYFPVYDVTKDSAEVLRSFLAQFYLSDRKQIPNRLVVAPSVANKKLWQDVLRERAGHKVIIRERVKGQDWLAMAKENARSAIAEHRQTLTMCTTRFRQLELFLNFPVQIERIECFDVSHTMGNDTVASCVVFSRYGIEKDQYRKFNITNITAGDDCAAIFQAVIRRYKRLLQENRKLPDVVFIDGGKGQIKSACEALEECGIMDLRVIGVAKGISRKPGNEKLILEDGKSILTLQSDNPALHLIQNIRDEAHRFAITMHRKKRLKTMKKSSITNITGIGAKRHKALLNYFGGIERVRVAGVHELVNVEGISHNLAKKIHLAFH